MLSDHIHIPLHWLQREEHAFELMANDHQLMTYCLVQPLRGVWVIQSDRHRLTLTPERIHTQWVVTGRDNHPMTTLTHTAQDHLHVAGGLTYTWQVRGIQRVFYRAGGPEVLHTTTAKLAQRLGAALTLTHPAPERDLVLLAGLAMHLIVLEGQPV